MTKDENPRSELTQLLKAQRKARENEVYGACRSKNEMNTTGEQSAFTNWTPNFS